MTINRIKISLHKIMEMKTMKRILKAINRLNKLMVKRKRKGEDQGGGFILNMQIKGLTNKIITLIIFKNEI
jgi:hypothetical protein